MTEMLNHRRAELLRRLRGHLFRLYPSQGDACMRRLEMLVGRYGVGAEQIGRPYQWDQHDSVLITYGNTIQEPDRPPLKTLREFLNLRLQNVVNTVHILPFFPYSSDAGFSITDYREVNPDLGGWEDVSAIGRNFRLMVDLVLNHVSRESDWFTDYVNGLIPRCRYFIEACPESDLSDVVRPRSSPLLTPVRTRDGDKHVWTTFSPDQVDLDFTNPDVLFEFLDILFYYISKGACVIRLDAIAYLWKKMGTSCIHLSETHEVVKLFRTLVELVAPHVVLITETNVPHEENISYFGQADEAHMVYQFSLPPLLLHGLHRGTAAHLREWAAGLGEVPSGCTFLNFTASHDGIGLRPIEGLVPPEEVDQLVDAARERGGLITTRKLADGTDKPYELNITYYDALRFLDADKEHLNVPRFLCSQAVALALKGIPAIYIHSLFATRNDHEAAEETGVARSINRSTLDFDDLERRLDDETMSAGRVFQKYHHLLDVRRRQPAFHPDGAQRVPDVGDDVFALERTEPGGGQRVLALNNFSDEAAKIDLSADVVSADTPPYNDLIAGDNRGEGGSLELAPYETVWLDLGSPR